MFTHSAQRNISSGSRSKYLSVLSKLLLIIFGLLRFSYFREVSLISSFLVRTGHTTLIFIWRNVASQAALLHAWIEHAMSPALIKVRSLLAIVHTIQQAPFRCVACKTERQAPLVLHCVVLHLKTKSLFAAYRFE